MMRSIITTLLSSARGSRRVGLAIATAAFVLAGWSTIALAAPVWRIDASGNTTGAPGGDLPILVQVTNIGDAAADGTGTPITLTGSAPPGVDIVSVTPTGGAMFGWDCSATTSTTISCTDSSDVVDTAANAFGLNYGTLTVDATVNGAPVGSTVTTTLQVGGGGAATASTVEPTKIASDLPGFGIDALDGQVSDAVGGAFTQAGGHPDAASVSLDFNTSTDPNPFVGPLWPIEPVRDVVVDLPPGFVGNATNSEQCTPSLLSPQTGGPRCPSTSQVGTTLVRLNGLSVRNVLGPIAVYNMVPPPNVPARFGFNVAGNVVTLDAHLRSGSDYGLSIEAHNIPEGLGVAGTTVTFWGVPASPAHDAERACTPTTLSPAAPWEGGPACASGATQTAFLRNPTSCTAPGVGLPTTVHVDSWDHPGTFVSQTFVSHLPPAYPAAPADQGAQQGPTGCAQVPFDPTLAGTPDTSKASSPSGFAFDVRLPQTDDPVSIGEGDLRKAVVTLPAGVRVSASSAGGLDACTPDQVGLHSEADASCPDASKVGSLTIKTPLLRDQLTGSIYLAKPHDNPFDSLIAIYLVARGPGLIVKLAGQVAPDPVTGQLTATFDDQPQLPFSTLHLEFKGGPRAPLATPRMCGSYSTHAVLTSWSGKVVTSDSPFTVDRNSQGGPCANPGFAPGFSAGTENPVAGATSPFQLAMTRGDDDQELKSLTVDMPG
ncbi:MAG TPA: hypothetical protein VFF79_06855, partial [Conexibacter sp.]|nr:hypothetical protein [Conexibacter sp.]